MPSRPVNLHAFDESALHILNQFAREVIGRLDDLQKQIPPHTQLKSSSTLVFGTVPANSSADAVVLLPGANTTGVAHANPAQGIKLPTGLSWSAQVTAQNQVTVRVANSTAGGIAVNTQKWNIFVIQ